MWTMFMELQSLRYFMALFEEGHFGRAATRCGITQPSMTNAIKRLEQEVGGDLFVRKPKIQPTALALRLKPHVEEILGAVLRAKQTARQMLRNVEAVNALSSRLNGKTRSL
jgi:DNA-binding transcriptional LysR family regulator